MVEINENIRPRLPSDELRDEINEVFPRYNVVSEKLASLSMEIQTLNAWMKDRIEIVQQKTAALQDLRLSAEDFKKAKNERTAALQDIEKTTTKLTALGEQEDDLRETERALLERMPSLSERARNTQH